MTFRAWRICKQKHSRDAFSGEGARLFGGRWNNPGTLLVYVAESQALAALEMLAHLDAAELLTGYILIPVEIDESFISHSPSLPKNWKAYPVPAETKMIGDEWQRSGKSAALKVPSTLVPSESNFLLNPLHPDFSRLMFGEPLSFGFDNRLRKLRKP